MQLQLAYTHKVPVILHDNFRCKSHKHYGHPTSVILLQLLRKQRTMAPPSLWLQKHTDLRAHDFAHSRDLWHQSRLANVTCALSWRLCGINPATLLPHWQETAGIARHCFRSGMCVGAVQYAPRDVSMCIVTAKEMSLSQTKSEAASATPHEAISWRGRKTSRTHTNTRTHTHTPCKKDSTHRERYRGEGRCLLF